MGFEYDSDKLHEECGVFGIFGHKDAAAMTALGLHALQHRGQEAAGIVTYDGELFYAHKALGLVGANFSSQDIIDSLKGHAAIGHNRYATTGDGMLRNVQPMYADMDFGGFAIAHNGNLTNAHTIRQNLVKRGSIFQSTSDTEVLVHLVALSDKTTLAEKLTDAVRQVKGGYALLACANNQLVGVRDAYGIRPMALGELDGNYILASESCAFDIIGATFIRDIEAGEMVTIDENGISSHFPFKRRQRRSCIFEYIYFARPDSFMDGYSVYDTRKNIGKELAREASAPGADLVVPVPDSGTPAAIGFAQESGIPFELGIIRNHYIGRTFIEPGDNIRNLGVKLKHNANRRYLEGKSVVLVDDSIVRGTTSRKIVEMVREAGAREVHMRISSPPTSHSCFYGIDTPNSNELLAHTKSAEEICKIIKADSLAYISLDGLYRAVGETRRNADAPQYCDACFTGDYPVELVDHEKQMTGAVVTDLREHKISKN